MSHPSTLPKRLLALLALLAAILACTVLLEAQSPAGPAGTAQNPHEQTTISAMRADEASTAAKLSPVPGDPAFLVRANNSLLLARKGIDKFFEQSANVVCTEDVSQTLVGSNGKPVYREESVFEYQLLASTRSGSLKLAESREAHKEAFRDPNRTLLITNGFSSMLLVLHQNFEPSYMFEPVGEEVIDGRTLVKIHFKPVPGASSPAAIQLRSRNYPLPLAGDVWIDAKQVPWYSWLPRSLPVWTTSAFTICAAKFTIPSCSFTIPTRLTGCPPPRSSTLKRPSSIGGMSTGLAPTNGSAHPSRQNLGAANHERRSKHPISNSRPRRS